MIDPKLMIDAGVHFGHKTSRWSPKMRPYIWGTKNRVHLIDVSKTAILLERAGNFLKDLAGNGGKFLFVGTKKAAQSIVLRAATTTKMPYVINRWVGGTLSNYDQVKKAVTRLLHMRDVIQKSTTHYKKKEISMIQKEIARLEKNVGGIIDLEYPPAAIIVIDAKKECSAIKEANSLGIPVISLVDTNTDPSSVNFVIPTNDDSPKAIAFVVEYLESRIQEGLKVLDTNKAAARAQKAAEIEAKRAATPVAKPAAPAAQQQSAPVRQAAPAQQTAPVAKEAKTTAPEVKKPTVAAAPAAPAPVAAKKAPKPAPAKDE